MRSLHKALELVGASEKRLAAALSISQDELQNYLSGKKPLPHQTFLDVLDIVAGTNNNHG